MKKTDRPSVREEVGQLEPLHTAGGGGCQLARAAWKARVLVSPTTEPSSPLLSVHTIGTHVGPRNVRRNTSTVASLLPGPNWKHQVSTNNRMTKSAVAHSHNGILHRNSNEWTLLKARTSPKNQKTKSQTQKGTHNTIPFIGHLLRAKTELWF